MDTVLNNRYRLDVELGRDGMGTVYRAYDTLLDRPVAVKLLNETGIGTEGRARLLREAQAAARLHHPNFVSMYVAGEVDRTTYIVMELLEGVSLYDPNPKTINEIIPIIHDEACCLQL
jgi:serine/threonine-protein kinase